MLEGGGGPGVIFYIDTVFGMFKHYISKLIT